MGTILYPPAPLKGVKSAGSDTKQHPWLLMGIYLLFKGTSAGLKSTWTPLFHPAEGQKCESSGPPCWGKKNTALNWQSRKKEGKPESEMKLYPNYKWAYKYILIYIYFWGENRGHYVKTKINKESVNQEKFCSPMRAKPQPSGTQWLLIMFDEWKAIWWFNICTVGVHIHWKCLFCTTLYHKRSQWMMLFFKHYLWLNKYVFLYVFLKGYLLWVYLLRSNV